MDKLDGLCSGGLAVSGIDQLEAANIDVVLERGRLDLSQWSDKRRLDDAGFGGVGNAAQRAFVAGVHDDGRRRGDRFRSL